MEVISYSPSICDKWDAFVSSHEYAWVGHHSATFELEKEFGGENVSLLVVDDKNSVVGIMPLFLFVRRVKKIMAMRSIRSGSTLRNGPLLLDSLSDKQKRDTLDLLIHYLIVKAGALKIDDIFISYPVMHGNVTCLDYYGYFPLKKYGFVESNKVTMIKDLRSDEQSLFASLRKNCRNSIRKCIEEGGEFVHITNKSQWMNCYDLNVQTFSTETTKPFTRRVMELLWDNFVEKGLAEVTAVQAKGKIISVSIAAVMKNACYPWIGFNSKPSPITGGNNLRTWKTMLHFKQKGVTHFEIGSREFADIKQMNISAYKESFQGKDCYCLDGRLILRPLKESIFTSLSLFREHITRRKSTES